MRTSTPSPQELRLTEARAFHLLLLGVVVPVLSLPFTWGAWIWSRRRARITGARRWARRLLALALVDTVVALALVSLLFVAPTPRRLVRAEAPPPTIGVRIDAEVSGGVRVTPLPISPAARGGVLEGDVITRVDAMPIHDGEDLHSAIFGGAVAPRAIELLRDGEVVSLEVTPERGTRAGGTRPGSAGLFTPQVALQPAACVSAELARPTRGALLPAFLALGLLALFAFIGRGHRPIRFLIPAVLVFTFATFVGGVARAGSCAAFGGHAPGTFLLALLANGVVLALGAWWLARRVGPTPPILPTLSAPRVVATSLYYTITWIPRAFVVVFALAGVAAWLAQTGTPIDAFADSRLGAGGVLLLLLGGAVVGPIAEEIFFRGAVLPWLAGFSRPWVAITLSASLFGALHVHHGMALVGPLAVGMILGWARARSDGLRVPILLHAAFNAASILVFAILE